MAEPTLHPINGKIDAIAKGIEDLYATAGNLKRQADTLRQSGVDIEDRASALEKDVDALRKDVAGLHAREPIPAPTVKNTPETTDEEVFIGDL